MATPANVTPASEQELRQALVTIQDNKIVITDQHSYSVAADELLRIKTFRKNWKTYWYGDSGPVTTTYAAYKSALAKFNEGDKPAETKENEVKRAILSFDMEQEKLRQEAQRKADEEARQKEQQERDAQAVEMELSGASDDDIENMIAAPPTAVAAPVAPTYQKASGVSRRDNWCVRVNSLKDLCKAIGAGKFKLSAQDSAKLVAFLESLLKPQATANKLTMAIPGCQAYNDPIISGRAR